MFNVQSYPDKHKSVPVPLDSESPWPKFRGNALQNGRSYIKQWCSNAVPWEVHTSIGIFSSPVIDSEGNTYIGSGDHIFYAFSPTGEELWRFPTRDIIDSSALLDDRGRIYVPSGDGHVYCLDKKNGEELWRFKAHSTDQVREEFGIKTYNLNWFEGNLSILPDGTILAPNDNYLVYGINRENGKMAQHYPSNEMGWSCPAVNGSTGRIFFGSVYFALKNLLCYGAETGERKWTSGGLGTVSASPLLTNESSNGLVVTGGFDGILRAFSQKNGKQIWKYGVRDHIYGSPAQLSDGTIVQAACDGTLYGLDAATGEKKWDFDTSQPIRSSPVVDGYNRIYFGGGDGRLYCINPDGTFRWAYSCIEGDRNDLNGSPALGPEGVVIGGENGGIFFIPYDYPLTETGRKNPRAIADYRPFLIEGPQLFYMNGAGRIFPSPPDSIEANEPLNIVHYVTEGGSTLLSVIDEESLNVTGPDGMRVHLSSNRRFITLIPGEHWSGPEGGPLEIRVRCAIRTRMQRLGLKFFGGRIKHQLDKTFRFSVRPYKDYSERMPYRIPAEPGDAATSFRLSRLSCPRPTLLPSYNQIGFDSLNYLAGIVEGNERQALLWVIPGRYDETTKRVEPDPELYDVYTMGLIYNQGLVTLTNYIGFAITFFGSWDMPFGLFRMASRVNPVTGHFEKPGDMNALIHAKRIRFYGRFLSLLGMARGKDGVMPVSGRVDMSLWTPSVAIDPTKAGEGRLSLSPNKAELSLTGCRLRKSEHVFGLLLVNTQNDRPVPVNYARETTLKADENGFLTGISVNCRAFPLKGQYRVYLMSDTTQVLMLDGIL